jgi:hypothetical protein
MHVWEVRLSGYAGYRGSRAPVGFRDVVEDETTNLPFDIARLVADWNLLQKQGGREGGSSHRTEDGHNGNNRGR